MEVEERDIFVNNEVKKIKIFKDKVIVNWN